MLNPSSRKGTHVLWLIGGVCLIVGQLIGWWTGYGRGKKDALRETGRTEEYNRRRKTAAAQNRAKKPATTGQGKTGPSRNKKR